MFAGKLGLALSTVNTEQQLSMLVCKQSRRYLFPCTDQAALIHACVQDYELLIVHVHAS